MEENKRDMQDNREREPSYEALLEEVQELRRQVERQEGDMRACVKEEVGRAARRQRGRAGQRRKRSRRLLKAQQRQFSRIGLILTAYFAAAVLVQMGAMIPAALISGGRFGLLMENPLFLWLISALPMYAVAFPIAAGLFTLLPKAPARGGERWGSGRLMGCVVIGMGLGFLGNLLGNLVNSLLSSPSDASALEEILARSPSLMNIAFVVFAAPVAEELLFRKFLIDRIGGYGEGLAVLLSGLLFGLAHGNFSQFFYTFAIGCLWAYVYVKTGNIGYTIAFHMLFNLIGGGIVLLLSKMAMGVMEPGGLLWRLDWLLSVDLGDAASVTASLLVGLCVLFEAACAIAGAVLLVLYRKRIVFLPGRERIGLGRGLMSALFNPGMLLYLAFCGWMFFLN